MENSKQKLKFAKGKLHIVYSSPSTKTDLFHGVRQDNIKKVLRKRLHVLSATFTPLISNHFSGGKKFFGVPQKITQWM